MPLSIVMIDATLNRRASSPTQDMPSLLYEMPASSPDHQDNLDPNAASAHVSIPHYKDDVVHALYL